MTIFFSIIFCLSLGCGWAWGYVNQADLLGYGVSIVIGGFIGSCIISIIFTYLYFFQKETDKEKIERLKTEINELKDVKRIEQ